MGVPAETRSFDLDYCDRALQVLKRALIKCLCVSGQEVHAKDVPIECLDQVQIALLYKDVNDEAIAAGQIPTILDEDCAAWKGSNRPLIWGACSGTSQC